MGSRRHFQPLLALAMSALALGGCDAPKSGAAPNDKPSASKPAGPPIDTAALAALPSEARAAIQRAPLPVLVVNRPAMLQASKLMVHRSWVALATQHDGVTVSLSGKRVAHSYPQLPTAKGNAKVRGVAAFVSANEQIWSATWQQYGVSYTLDVECNALPDPRCADARFVLELAASLAHVGGAEVAP